MLTIVTRSFPLFRKKEIWFYDGKPVNEGDYNVYCYVQGNFNLNFDRQLKESTTIIDLMQSEDELFNSINTTFKYHIRKADKMDLTYTSNVQPSVQDCKKLIHSFEKFAMEKKITPMNKRRIYALQKSNNIIVTKIKEGCKNVATHVYLFDKQRILLMHTFHDLNYTKHRERGYANKYLHWKDLLLFKEMNFTVYDFGGIDREKVPGISDFKLSFGGNITEANSYIRVKPLFKLFFKLYKLIR